MHPLHILTILCVFFCTTGMAWSQPDTTGPDQVRCGDWPRFLGVHYNGVATAASPGIDWRKRPTMEWSIDVGDGYGMGSVANDRYFHFDAGDRQSRPDPIDERLRAFDLGTGKELWSSSEPIEYQDLFGYEEGPRSTPTIDHQQVFTLGVSGQLTCREIDDGKIIWSVDTSKTYHVIQNFFGVGSSPLVLGKLVIAMVGGSPPADRTVAPMRLDRVSPNGSAVVAFDRDTGNEVWKCGDDLASYSSPRSIQIDGVTFVLVFAREGLLLIDPNTGSVRWRFDHRASILESVNAIMPVVDNDRVFISECYEVGSVLLQVDNHGAKVIWQDPARDRRRQSMRCHWATPILFDGFLYGCSGRNSPDSDLRCVELETGKVGWSDPRRIRSSVTRVGDHLIVLEERGLVQVIRPNSQKLEVIAEWPLNKHEQDRPALGYPCWAAPIVVGDKLLLRGTDRVLCMRLQR